jgi:hypothetical protein
MVQGLEFSTEELEKILEALSRVGDGLRDNPATTEFGALLTEKNLARAADELEVISENAARLSPDTHHQIADQFSNLVRELYLSQYDAITDVFGAAVESLRGGDFGEIGHKLGRVSGLLRDLNSLRSDQVVLHQDEYDPDDTQITRLEGFGEAYTAERAEDLSDLLTSPGGGSFDSGQTLGDAVNLTGTNYETEEEGDLPSYTVPWEAKHVVSSYFSPR